MSAAYKINVLRAARAELAEARAALNAAGAKCYDNDGEDIGDAADFRAWAEAQMAFRAVNARFEEMLEYACSRE